MGEEELILSIVAIVFGTAFMGFVIGGAFRLARTYIENKYGNKSGDLDPQFFKALAEFKRSTEKRLNNLEAIVTNEGEEPVTTPSKSPTGSIEIEDDEIREDSSKSGNNLRNMLNE